MEFVELKCIKERSKLRVRIITPGYLGYANCQFPRDIREEGARYKVRPESIKLITARGRWFYSIKRQDVLEIIKNDVIAQHHEIHNIQIYEDQDETDCAICMSSPKDTVFYPCGHYHTCATCANMVHNCPMCMKKIEMRINRNLID